MDKIIKYFINNKLVVNIFLIIILVIGISSLFNLKQEIFPPTEIDTMVVTVRYPGASSQDVEMNAVIPIENTIRKISGIKDYVSLAVENGAIVYIYIDPDANNKSSIKNEIYRNLQIVPDISPDVDDIVIVDINPKLMSILSVGLTLKENNKNPDIAIQKKLYDFVDQYNNKLSKVQGVSEIRVSGYKESEIQIAVDPKKMKNYYISLNEVIGSIKNRNIRSTGGSLQSIQKEKNIVTIGEFSDPMDVKDVIIRSSFQKKKVIINDVAKVKDGFKKDDILIRVNQKQGVTLNIVKKENADVVETVRNVKKFIEKTKDQIPGLFTLKVIDDRSLSIVALLDVVKSNALIGFILVFLILLIFLDFRSAIWTAFGIPVTILMILSVMNIIDISLNLISLGAVITVLGMLVDHGIVISENIYSYKKAGYSGREAALLGIREVFVPVVITILTTIVAFLPLLFVKGMMGKFIYVYPIIITVALIASFIEAVFFLPNHLSHSKNKIKTESKKWFNTIISFYKKILTRTIRFRYPVVGFFILLLIATFFISKDTIKNYTLFYDNSSDAFYINLEAPRGTSLKQTSKLVSKVEKMVMKKVKENERISIKTIIGHHTVKRINSKGNHENWGQITVYLIPSTERKRSVQQIMKSCKKDINEKKLKEFDKVLYAKQVIGPSPGKAVDLKIIGGSEENRTAAWKEIAREIKKMNGVMEIDDDQKQGKDEIKIIFDYDKLAQLNMNVASVAETVRAAYEGAVATSIQTVDRKIDFRVYIDDSFKRNTKFLNNLLIPNKQGRLIKLSEIASFENKKSKAMINHYNGDRAITITAKINKEKTTATLITKQIKAKFSTLSQKYNDIYLVFKGESAEASDSMRDLIVAFILSILAIYLVLVLLFNSLDQPFIILITIPFGLIGALLAFTIHGIPLSFMGIVGIIGLSGVVVNDSVVMVDFINRVIKQNKNEEKTGIINDIIEGAGKRLRPVILTTLTTVAALLPTVYSIGGNVASLTPTVMGLCYGILFATTLTLFLIPSLYVITIDIKGLLSKNR